MSSPTPPPPVRSGPAVSLLAAGKRLVSRLRRRPTAAGHRASSGGAESLQAVGQRLRLAREARGLTLRQLCQETRISITVLEGIERGWRDRLPEPAYLRTMLSLLEQHLDLEAGSLEAALPPRHLQSARPGLDPRQRPLSLTSIELFTTWQGTVLYALLCLLLLYGLNRQQERLAARGLLSLRPLPPASAVSGTDGTTAASRDRNRILEAYPELRPLESARTGRALSRLRLELRQATKPAATQPGPAAARPGDGGVPSPRTSAPSGRGGPASVPTDPRAAGPQDAAEPDTRP